MLGRRILILMLIFLFDFFSISILLNKSFTPSDCASGY